MSKEYTPSKNEQDMTFKKRHEMYMSTLNENSKKIEVLSAGTNYNEFPKTNDYTSGYRANPKLKLKDTKLRNNSNIDIKLRKKVKTAGENNYESLFQTTFGSFNQLTSFNNTNEINRTNPLPLNLIDNPFDFSYEENCTPTLPNVENQGMRHEDQPMPRPIPRIQNNVENTEYSYR